jgi:hypothetical protein
MIVTPLPAPPSRFARAASRGLSALWDRGLLPPPVLEADRLIAGALAAERLDDFGPDHWRAPFARLIEALVAEADLNPVGRTLACGQLSKALRERLRAHHLWRVHPDILDRPIAAPIVILGSMRSGTTRIQRLLACDERLAHTRLFESISPVPERVPPGWDLRPAKAAAGLMLLQMLNPALGHIHPTGAYQPEEEFGLFSFAFKGAQFETQWRVPGFARWCEAQDPARVYREFRQLLQTICWFCGNTGGRPWLLKAPQFMEDPDALLAEFPDARLICLHRDPVAVVASSASLAWQQMRVQSDTVDPCWVGREWLHKTVRRVKRAGSARLRHPRIAQIDLDFAAVDRDWLTEIRRIYAFLGMELTPAVAAKMRGYLKRSMSHKGHRYDPGQFGLSDREIRDALPDGA